MIDTKLHEFFCMVDSTTCTIFVSTTGGLHRIQEQQFKQSCITIVQTVGTTFIRTAFVLNTFQRLDLKYRYTFAVFGYVSMSVLHKSKIDYDKLGAIDQSYDCILTHLPPPPHTHKLLQEGYIFALFMIQEFSLYL